MRRLGYEEEAERIAEGLFGAVEREGLREYYDPRDGTGLGAVDFAWSALIAEMATEYDPGKDAGRARSACVPAADRDPPVGYL